MDGTCVPATGADTRGRKGRNGGEAGSRQLRIVAMCEYETVDAKGRSIPIPGSFSYAVFFCNALELKGHVKKLAETRGRGASSACSGGCTARSWRRPPRWSIWRSGGRT